MTSRKYGLLSVALIFLLAASIQYFTLTCPDVAWLTWSTQQILAGGVPYRDVIEINPPLIYALYAPPILLAQLLGVPVAFTLKIYIAILAAGSAIFAASILARSPLWSGNKNILPGLGALLLLVPDSFITFGQREHLLIIFTLPYFVLNIPSVPARAFSPRIPISIGIFAGISFCIKPHFFAIWIVLMGFKVLRSRSFKTFTAADLMVPFVACVYALIALYFMPDFLAMVSVAKQVYRSYHGNMTSAELAPWFATRLFIGLVVAAVAGLFRRAPDAPYRRDVVYLSVLACGGFLEALLQFNNWGYILYPFIALGLLALCYPLLLRPWNNVVAAIILLAFLYPVTPMTDARQHYYRDLNAKFEEQLGAYKHSKDLYYLGLFIAPPQWFRNEAPLRWSSSMSSEGPVLAGMMQLSPETGLPTITVRPGYEGLEHWLLDTIAMDIKAKQPSLIVMEKRVDITQPSQTYFDFHEWFKQDSRLSSMMTHYSHAKDMSICDDEIPPVCVLYQLFTRKAP